MEEQFNVLVLKDTSNLADYIQMASTHTYIPWKPNNQALLASLIEFLDNYTSIMISIATCYPAHSVLRGLTLKRSS